MFIRSLSYDYTGQTVHVGKNFLLTIYYINTQLLYMCLRGCPFIDVSFGLQRHVDEAPTTRRLSSIDVSSVSCSEETFLIG